MRRAREDRLGALDILLEHRMDSVGRDHDVGFDDVSCVEDRRRRPGILHKLCAPAARMHHSLGQRSGQQGYQVCPVHAEVRGVRAIRLR